MLSKALSVNRLQRVAPVVMREGYFAMVSLRCCSRSQVDSRVDTAGDVEP